ncbi:hypothetical protein BX661DRAFT_38726 [Kickxella alabastrina]|uniref:uncharacterized protein n=1 Tax=Kickxella alabastrina TaxID=61397 RepID=UPI00222005F5|nr:uncharacterized protein BX661DRAFT_38726 [Kickxella alabastrina]KAI7825470.1 hypothetical protein BX661DRAFT_38726 [Kickxella alabastrina]
MTAQKPLPHLGPCVYLLPTPTPFFLCAVLYYVFVWFLLCGLIFLCFALRSAGGKKTVVHFHPAFSARACGERRGAWFVLSFNGEWNVWYFWCINLSCGVYFIIRFFFVQIVPQQYFSFIFIPSTLALWILWHGHKCFSLIFVIFYSFHVFITPPFPLRLSLNSLAIKRAPASNQPTHVK